MQAAKVGWGILGTAQIARKNWRGIATSGNATIAALASRDKERSQRFIRECQAEAPLEAPPLAFGSYEELLNCKAVEAVYIPLPTGLRKEWVLQAAAAGKHVLCEKPCAVNVADLAEMLDACRRNSVQFMDGVMFMHSKRLERMRQILDDRERFGTVRRITSSFSFRAEPDFFHSNIRTKSQLEPHGCVGDLGWYCIRLALCAMNWQMPRQVTGRILSQSGPDKASLSVPTEFSGELFFENGISAGFYCSFITDNQQWAVISGTNGYVNLQDFVLPFIGHDLSFEVCKADFRMSGGNFEMVPQVQRVRVEEPSHGKSGSQESNLFRNFSEQMRSGGLNSFWPEIALKTQKVMCASLDSARNQSRPVELG